MHARTLAALPARGAGLLLAGLLLLPASLPAAAQERTDAAERLYRDALPALQHAVAARPSHAAPYLALARAYLHLGRPDAADAVVTQGLARLPAHPGLLLAHADVFLHRHDLDGAIRVYERLRDADAGPDVRAVLDSVRVPARLAELYFTRGTQALQEHQAARAAADLQRSRALGRDSASTYQNLAYAHLQQRDWRKADEAARAGLARFPDHLDLLRLRGAAAFRLEDAETLRTVYATLHRRLPDDGDVQLAYAQALALGGEPLQAMSVLWELIETPQAPRAAYEVLIGLLQQRLNLDGVVTTLERMQARFPEDPAVARRLAEAYEATHRWPAARRTYERLLALGGDTLAVTLALAETYVRQDSAAGALPLYDRLHARYPAHPALLRARGDTRQAAGLLTAAVADFERLVQVDPGPTAWQRLGEARLQAGRKESAAAAFRQALAAGPRRPAPYYQLARVLEAAPQLARTPDEACGLLEAAVRHALHALERMAAPGAAAPGAGDPLVAAARRGAPESEALNDLALEAVQHYGATCAPARAQAVLDSLVHAYPTSGPLHYALGRFYMSHQQPEAARPHLEAAARLAPRVVDHQLALAAYYEQTGAPAQAVLAYERVLSLDAASRTAYAALLRLAAAQQRLPALLRRWEARLRGDPENEALHQAVADARARAAAADAAAGADTESR